MPVTPYKPQPFDIANFASKLPAPVQRPAGAIGQILADLLGADTVANPSSPESQVMAIAAPVQTGETLTPVGQAVANVLKRIKNPIKAYHGSPHDFEQFDLSKIGTGEGAQAYGHGAYFAQREDVARSYRNALSPAAVNGLELPEILTHADPVRDRDMFEQQLAKVTADLNQWSANGYDKQDWMQRAVADARRVKAGIEHALAGAKPTPLGKMYEVNIHADPSTLLDWDKPLSQQPQAVQKAAQKFAPPDLRVEYERGPVPVAERHGGTPNPDGFVVRVAADGGQFSTGIGPTREAALDDARKAFIPRDGRTFYEAVARKLEGGAGQMFGRGSAPASDYLAQNGINGIQYLDGGSRAAGEGSRNYVVFDDSLIEILRKWGLIPPATAAALSRKESK